jgi:hypothetical protein
VTKLALSISFDLQSQLCNSSTTRLAGAAVRLRLSAPQAGQDLPSIPFSEEKMESKARFGKIAINQSQLWIPCKTRPTRLT